MSAGQSTYFCENGHMVYDTGEDEVYYDAKIESCSVCGTKKIRGCHEWHDKDYDPAVSHKPLRIEKEFIPKPASLKIYQQEFLDDGKGVEYHEIIGGKFFIKKQTAVYNVKKLFKEKVKS